MVKPIENAMLREPERYRALTDEAKLEYWERRLPTCEAYRTRLVKRLNATRKIVFGKLEEDIHGGAEGAKLAKNYDSIEIEAELTGAIFLCEECERAIKSLKGGKE